MPASPWMPSLAALAGGLLLGLPATAHEVSAPASPQAAQPDRLPLVPSSELVTYFVNPRWVGTAEAFEIARNLYGRDYYVVERGGYASRPVSNLQWLGDSIIVYDVEARAHAISDALGALDEEMGRAEPPSVALETLSWGPRHVSLDGAWTAISNLRREIDARDERGGRLEVPNLTLVRERGLILIQETPERLATVRGLLERIDVPEPQLLVTCLILEGTNDPAAGAQALPAELTANLSQLVPFTHFQQVGFGVVRSSARAAEITLQLDQNLKLVLRPEAFDAQTGQMTASVKYGSHLQGFETRTTIAADEYTVLGAAGGRPVFTVIRLHPLELGGEPRAADGVR